MTEPEEKRMRDCTAEELVEALASKEPTPGGGTGAAMAAAVGCALGEMVANLTHHKRRYEEVQPKIEEYLPKLEELRGRMFTLAEEDAEAFRPLARAYRMPRDTEEEKEERTRVLEEALRQASEPPEHLMEAICEAIVIVDDLTKIGSKMVLTDAGAGAALLSASLKAACLNVFINAKAMKDRDYAEILVSRTQAMLEDGCAKADEAYLRVERGIRWQRS